MKGHDGEEGFLSPNAYKGFRTRVCAKGEPRSSSSFWLWLAVSCLACSILLPLVLLVITRKPQPEHAAPHASPAWLPGGCVRAAECLLWDGQEQNPGTILRTKLWLPSLMSFREQEPLVSRPRFSPRRRRVQECRTCRRGRGATGCLVHRSQRAGVRGHPALGLRVASVTAKRARLSC